MKLLALIAIVTLCSCTGYVHEAHSASGNYVRDVLVKVGGSASLRGSDGSSLVTDDQQSFRDAATAATGISAAIAQKSVAVAKEATSRVANTNATKQAINASNNAAAVEQARISAQSAATSEAIQSGATVNPITVTPP